MKILYHKNFDKHFKKLTDKLQNKVIAIIEVFRKNPFDPVLKNHPLKGELNGTRAISVAGDIRIVFEEHDSYVLVIMLDIGTHNQVYG